jgi:hypothetical protein
MSSKSRTSPSSDNFFPTEESLPSSTSSMPWPRGWTLNSSEFVKSHRDLKEKVLSQMWGGYLQANPSAWPGLALHFNQMPKGFHWDWQSLHCGLDIICPWGPFENCLLVFPHLGIAIRVHPGDVIFLRGAGLSHGVKEWTGKGRMVMVPFVDRRLFGGSQVKRPKTFRPLYSHQYHHLRQLFPVQPLADIL